MPEEKIDEELEPLIKELNKVGIKTTYSCSGHGSKPGYIAIDLSSLVLVRINNKHIVLDWWIHKPDPTD